MQSVPGSPQARFPEHPAGGSAPERPGDPVPASPLSVTDFRGELARLMAAAGTVGERPPHTVVFALDGVDLATARRCWPAAETRLMRSVTPTTSSACWLSALTGLDTAAHGVPGVVFADPSGGPGLVDFLSYRGPGLAPDADTVFGDAARLGRRPLALLGDMEHYGSAWRDALLKGAEPVAGHCFYTEGGVYRYRPAAEVFDRVRTAVESALERYGAQEPCLIWCYVEVDQHVHRHGYDRHTTEVLTALDGYARALVARGALVVAHADHGLVPTVHDEALAGLLDQLGQRYGFRMGGAGRMRWLHAAPGTDRAELAAVLQKSLPSDVRVLDADSVFPPGSPARARVGGVVLVAEGERFLTDPGYRYDHGSFAPGETDTPFSVWR
ncbi:alkaline phosphatase family protein [Streptomyces glaucus]|uniref:Type I phosphodiesterase/nucleotide pyrophosphatase n=1 Tax=Streptomyces glaucus TaxID=284029 RepID=A0ABN3J508_9ACTN